MAAIASTWSAAAAAWQARSQRHSGSVSGNRRRAAELLGIGERTLYDKLKRYGVE